MIAYLSMYERPGTAAAFDRFWALVRSHLGESAPRALTRDAALWDIWMSPDLLLGQTCGLPFRAHLRDHVTLVGTPDYGVAECPPGHYCSVVLTRGKDTRPLNQLRLAVNDPVSQSGWAAAAAYADARGETFGSALVTGAHHSSATAVLNGDADIAFVDAVSWDLMTEQDPQLLELHVADRTPPTPGLPFITAKGRDPAPLRTAVRAAIDGLTVEDWKMLRLRGIIEIPPESYLAIPLPPPLAAQSAKQG